jgi:hypothetical protein
MQILSKKITFENVLDFKPSELIESVIADIDYILENEITINMDLYFNHTKCAVCLGGAKLLCMNDANVDRFKRGKIGSVSGAVIGQVSEDVQELIPEIADLFDSIRLGNDEFVAINTSSIYAINKDRVLSAINDWDGWPFQNEINEVDIIKLKQQVQSLASLLRNAGM